MRLSKEASAENETENNAEFQDPDSNDIRQNNEQET
jgi:hypothetical protein